MYTGIGEISIFMGEFDVVYSLNNKRICSVCIFFSFQLSIFVPMRYYVYSAMTS